MEEQLITFETAKLAKEKGYVQTTYNHINIGDKPSELCSIGTQSLLQKWLREVHNIHIEIHSLDIKWWCNTKEINSNNAALFISDNYDSYEEALEAGLQEGLKLISNEL